MSTLNLYALCTLVWGSTWLAITFQLGIVPPAVSVVWRFALSALILFAYALAQKMPLRFAARDHLWLAVQGFFMFGFSYVCVYLSEQTLTSGLVAVVFSIMVFWNILGMRLFFNTPINPVTLVAAVLGVAGVALVFWPEIANFSSSGAAVRGLGLAVVGTVAASFGNLSALRNQRNHIPMIPQMAWAMLYGSIVIAVYAAVSGYAFTFEWSVPYVLSLIYLALFGSVIAFGFYLTLIKRIGVDRAGYVGVAIPIVALLLSTLFEDLEWQPSMVIGVLLSVVGNVLILRGKERHAEAS
jgi:drug/metabolite transporter (DMT)-like permease